jgi:hypothetical protein
MAAPDAVREDKDLVQWAKGFDLAPMEEESPAEFRQRFAHYMLTEQDDPVISREITLAKPIYDWDVMERAEFVLDYESFFDRSPHGRRHFGYSQFRYCKDTAGHKVAVVMNRRTRKAGAVASNPAEFLTAEGKQAGEQYANWDGIDPHWEGPVLKNAPRGFEEALAKRAACPTDDPQQGHLIVRHYDKDGKSSIKFIQPKDPVVDQSSTDDEVLLLSSGEMEKAETPHDHRTLEERAASCKKVDS